LIHIYTHTFDSLFEEWVQHERILEVSSLNLQTAKAMVTRAKFNGDSRAFWRVE